MDRKRLRRRKKRLPVRALRIGRIEDRLPLALEPAAAARGQQADEFGAETAADAAQFRDGVRGEEIDGESDPDTGDEAEQRSGREHDRLRRRRGLDRRNGRRDDAGIAGLDLLLEVQFLGAVEHRVVDALDGVCVALQFTGADFRSVARGLRLRQRQLLRLQGGEILLGAGIVGLDRLLDARDLGIDQPRQRIALGIGALKRGMVGAERPRELGLALDDEAILRPQRRDGRRTHRFGNAAGLDDREIEAAHLVAPRFELRNLGARRGEPAGQVLQALVHDEPALAGRHEPVLGAELLHAMLRRLELAAQRRRLGQERVIGLPRRGEPRLAALLEVNRRDGVGDLGRPVGVVMRDRHLEDERRIDPVHDNAGAQHVEHMHEARAYRRRAILRPIGHAAGEERVMLEIEPPDDLGEDIGGGDDQRLRIDIGEIHRGRAVGRQDVAPHDLQALRIDEDLDRRAIDGRLAVDVGGREHEEEQPEAEHDGVAAQHDRDQLHHVDGGQRPAHRRRCLLEPDIAPREHFHPRQVPTPAMPGGTPGSARSSRTAAKPTLHRMRDCQDRVNKSQSAVNINDH